MSAECRFKYKCRHCNEVFDGPIGGEDAAMKGLVSAIYNINLMDGLIGIPPHMHEIHHCKDDFVGVADLVGYEKK